MKTEVRSKLKTAGQMFLLFLAMTGPLFVGSAMAYWDGDPGGVASLYVFNIDGRFECEWVSPDGTQALCVTDNGRRRLVTCDRFRLEAGKHYRIKAENIPKFGTRLWVVPTA